ncbi:MAG: hypothetical protein K2N36_03010 [Ruminiclostridium sp.]|nr:hypothetical protein [Ruminiclostridium sp.]
MFEVIKGSSPAHQIIVDGDVKIGIGSKKKVGKTQSEQGDRSASEENNSDSELITMTQEELDSIRAQYRMDGEQYAEEMRVKTGIEIAHAKAEAEKMLEEAEMKASGILASAEDRVRAAEEEARNHGYEQGYRQGVEKGAEDGFNRSMIDGRAALQELQNLCVTIEKEKNELMAENRRAIFDLSMGIAQKITMAVLNQKDKSVLQKMITNAAKEFRKAKRVKVTLSRYDLSEDVETDLKTFERCFLPSTEVEFEVLEDGEKGTLQIETDTEILDAGVSTQLRMIEELGSGKYRDKEPEKEAEKEPEKEADREFEKEPEGFAADGEDKASDIGGELFEEPLEEKFEEKPEAKAEVKTRKRTTKAKAEKSEDISSAVSGEVPVTEDGDAE